MEVLTYKDLQELEKMTTGVVDRLTAQIRELSEARDRAVGQSIDLRVRMINLRNEMRKQRELHYHQAGRGPCPTCS